MKLLAISCYAPPQLTPQAIQVGRLLYHLAARVTLLHGRGPQFPDTYEQYPDFFQRVTDLPVADPGPLFKGVWHRAALRLLPVYGACPDQLGPWRRRACARALAHIADHSPDALASFGMPMSDHLVALELKRRTGLPWLAHFSDPWSDNVFHRTTRLEHQLNLALERSVVGWADQLLFTSARTLELVMRKYPPAWRDRAAVLPHAWDTGNFAVPLAPAATAGAGRRVVRYLGACYGERSPRPLFEALARLAASHPRQLDTVAFELIGPVAPALLDADLLAALPPGLVSVRAQVGYRASLQLAQDAAALLLIDAPSAADSVFLPSKLIDYIGVRRPIWGITPRGTGADLIADWSGGAHTCADPSDPEKVAAMLLAAIRELNSQAGIVLAPIVQASIGQAPVGQGELNGQRFDRQGCKRHGPDHVALRFAPERVAGSLKQYLRHAIGRCARAELAAAAEPPLTKFPP